MWKNFCKSTSLAGKELFRHQNSLHNAQNGGILRKKVYLQVNRGLLYEHPKDPNRIPITGEKLMEHVRILISREGYKLTQYSRIRIQMKGKLTGVGKMSTVTIGDPVPKVRTKKNRRGVIFDQEEIVTTYGVICIKMWIQP